MEAVDGRKVAVIGAAGLFPGGANGLRRYWGLLLRGGVVAAEPDRSRTELWEVMRDPQLAARITTLKGGYLSDITGFDAEYFGVAPREAVKLDPQQRLLLEVVHDALEDAGATRAELRSLNVGVFVGAGSTDYLTLDSRDKRRIDAYHGIGNSHSILANRISYYFNLKGPSLTIDTACSSSLTALHVAVQSLRHDDIDMAIVGGVNVIASPDLTLAFSQAKMLSPRGRCDTFGARADGYGRAEAVGAVVLARLSFAKENNCAIRCVIRASAVNQDGRSNGITAPNGQSQAEVIRAALARAGATPRDIAYVEAHGTGTPLGDAIEFNSLKGVFSAYPDARCAVGTAKANIGHAEAAAGICGLLKAMLMLEHGTIPPHPVSGPYNEFVDRTGNALRICQAAEPMESDRRCIGVSSFGFGGSNAHVVLERYDDGDLPVPQPQRPVLIVLSSHQREGLAADARALAEHMAGGSVALADAARTLCLGRDHLRYRQAWAVRSRDELLAKLTAPFSAEEPPAVEGAEKPGIAFVFTGQGAQYFNMGASLHEHAAPFREAFDRCAALIERSCGIPIADILYKDERRNAALLLEDTHLAQLGLFCFEYALAELWMTLGVKPDFVIGHSLGELVAHTVARGLSLPDAVALVDERGRLMQAENHAGAMVALFVEASAAVTLLQRLELPLHVAAENGKASVVVSGEREAVARLVRYLDDHAIPYRALDVRHAFHSPLFSGTAAKLTEFARRLTPNEPAIPVIGNLEGAALSTAALAPEYWGEHIVRPVKFARGVATLVERGVKVFLEIGPDRTLSRLIARDYRGTDVRALGSMERNQDSEYTLLQTAGALYRMGFELTSPQLTDRTGWRRVSLPARRLRRKRYWTGASASAASPGSMALDRNGADTRGVPFVQEAPAAPAGMTPSEAPGLPGVIGRQIKVMKSQLLLLGGR